VCLAAGQPGGVDEQLPIAGAGVSAPPPVRRVQLRGRVRRQDDQVQHHFRSPRNLAQRGRLDEASGIDAVGQRDHEMAPVNVRPAHEGQKEFGASETDNQFVPTIRELIDGVREAYKPFAPVAGSAQPTDTLITKVVLGTFGCLPACDRYFIDGFKSQGFKYSYLNDKFVECVRAYCHTNLADLRREQAHIERTQRDALPPYEARRHVLLADRL
jgi:hypothetical protein